MVLTPFQKEALTSIGNARQLRFIILHGSYAKGKERPWSDLDIAVLGRKRISFDDWSKIYNDIADVFADYRDQELDVKSLHGVEHLFRYYVTRDGVLLYGDPTDYAEYKCYAFRDFVDSADLRGLERALTRAKQEMLAR